MFAFPYILSTQRGEITDEHVGNVNWPARLTKC